MKKYTNPKLGSQQCEGSVRTGISQPQEDPQQPNLSPAYDEVSSRPRGSASTSGGPADSIGLRPEKRSASRDSSLNDDHSKSILDSISAVSSRNNLSTCAGNQDINDDNPSVGSIKGDSISATIANYHKKHGIVRKKKSVSSQQDDQSRVSAGCFDLATAGSSLSNVNDTTSAVLNKNDNSSVNINFFVPGCSTSAIITPTTSKKQSAKATKRHPDLASTLSVSNTGTEGSEIQDVDETYPKNTGSLDYSSKSMSGDEPDNQAYDNNATANHKPCGDHKKRTKHQSKTRNSKSNNNHNQGHHKSRHGHNRSERRHSSSSTSQQLQQQSEEAFPAGFEYEELPLEAAYQIEPIIIRGNGNLTLFGLSNSFNSEFPASLVGKVSREEFAKTIVRINSLLREQQSLSAKLLVIGGLFCCCSFGFSLVWPSIALKKRSKMNLEKFLATENSRLYSKLGMNWKLAEERCYSNHAFVEYVLMIEFTPKLNLYQPD